MFRLFHFTAIPAGFLGLLMGAWICRWMVAPLSGAAQKVQAPTRFSLTDFLWLIFLIQIEWGLVINLVAREGSPFAAGDFWSVLILGMVIVAGIWLGAVSTLSRAAVRDAKRRGLFTLVALPGMCLVIIGCLLVMASTSTFCVNLLRGKDEIFSGNNLLLLALAAGNFVGLIAMIPLLRLLNTWVARGGLPDLRSEKIQSD